MIDWTTVMLIVIVVGWLGIVAFALRDIWTSIELSDAWRLGWTLAVVFAPVLGTVAWFVTRPRNSSKVGRG